jgi:hypothetical protein
MEGVSSSIICWSQRLRFFQRRTLWWPTRLGLLFLFLIIFGPAAWWCAFGEPFLSSTHRLPAKVLVVEGWIGYDGIRAAASEFKQHGYEYVVSTGGLTSERWDEDRFSYAEMTRNELLRSGVANEKILLAAASDTDRQRTYESAVAVWRTFQSRNLKPIAMNVFTLGPHARRSRLVFDKVCGPAIQVGIVDWAPSNYSGKPWWQSSDRAKEFLTETAGYVFEVLLNSGRRSDPAR